MLRLQDNHSVHDSSERGQALATEHELRDKFPVPRQGLSQQLPTFQFDMLDLRPDILEARLARTLRWRRWPFCIQDAKLFGDSPQIWKAQALRESAELRMRGALEMLGMPGPPLRALLGV